MRQIVLADDFLEGNYLSTELRVPVTLLETNACSPLATNAIGGNIWDNFSSQSYKELPSVGTITVHDPFTGAPRPYAMPAGGRGYTRPPSLISVWSTAPFLLNNSVGKFESESLGRGAHGVLPGLDRADAVAGKAGEGRPCSATRCPAPSTARPRELPPGAGRLPARGAAAAARAAQRHLPWLFGEGGVAIGPIPAGTPVNLLANLELVPDGADLAAARRAT